MNAQQLKNSILQLAIQGKLVEQRPEEGTARELLQEISAEKGRLIREGKIKKAKPLPEISEDEIPFEVPESWEWVRLGDICQKIGSGNTPKGGKNSNVYKNFGVPLLREQNIYDDGLHFDGMVYISEQLSQERLGSKVYAGDILLNITGGSIGRCAIVPDEFNIGDINQHILIIRMVHYELRRYIHFCICSPLGKNTINVKAVGARAGFSAEKCRNMLIPIPPLAEQRRIVSKIEELLPYIDQYDKAYTKLNEWNEKFPESIKKSILQYAMEGKLVEQRPEEGTAEELLREIRAEKERLVKEGKIKKTKPLPEISEDEIPFEVPKNWKWVRLQDIFQLINGDRGKNYPAKSHLSSNGEIPFISAVNIENGSISKENLLYVDEQRYSLLRSGQLKKGDFVLCIRGSLGKFGRYPFERGAIASSLVILRPFVDEERLYQYLEQYLNTKLFTSEIRKYDNGTAQPNLGARDLAKFCVPLPPLAEQKRIVTRIEELFSHCNGL